MPNRPENDPMMNHDPGISPLQEAVWAVLEEAGVPDNLCEQIDKLLDSWITEHNRN